MKDNYTRVLISKKAHAAIRVYVARMSQKLGRRYTMIEYFEDIANAIK